MKIQTDIWTHDDKERHKSWWRYRETYEHLKTQKDIKADEDTKRHTKKWRYRQTYEHMMIQKYIKADEDTEIHMNTWRCRRTFKLMKIQRDTWANEDRKTYDHMHIKKDINADEDRKRHMNRWRYRKIYNNMNIHKTWAGGQTEIWKCEQPNGQIYWPLSAFKLITHTKIYVLVGKLCQWYATRYFWDWFFSTFTISKSETFLISNQSKRDQNFAVNFWNHQKQKWKLTKHNESEWNQSIIIHEILLDWKILLNLASLWAKFC